MHLRIERAEEEAKLAKREAVAIGSRHSYPNLDANPNPNPPALTLTLILTQTRTRA